MRTGVKLLVAAVAVAAAALGASARPLRLAADPVSNVTFEVSPDRFDEDDWGAPAEVVVGMDASTATDIPRTSACFVTLTAPAEADLSVDPPVRWAACTADPAFVTTGRAELRMFPPNPMANYTVAVYTCGPPSSYGSRAPCAPAAVRRNVLEPARIDFPWRPRVVPLTSTTPVEVEGGDKGTGDSFYAVLWTQRSAASPYLEMSSARDGPWTRVDPVEVSYPFNRSTPCAWPATDYGWFPPGVRVVVHLPPSVTAGSSPIWYRLGDDGGVSVNGTGLPLPWRSGTTPEAPATVPAMVSPVTRFRPAPAGGALSTKLALVADLGRGPMPGDDSHTWRQYSEDAINTTRRMASAVAAGDGDPNGGRTWWFGAANGTVEGRVDAGSIPPFPVSPASRDFDATIIVGDIAYATGYFAVWHEWSRDIAPIAARRPLYALVGNHESDVLDFEAEDSGRFTTAPLNGTDSGGECGVGTGGFVPQPWQDLDHPWYSLESGPVHVLSLSSEHALHPVLGPLQRAYAARDLAAVDKTRTPWLVVLFHRPAYIDSTYSDGPYSDQGFASKMRDVYEDLFREHGVDFVVAGHNHAVQRTCAVYQSKCLQVGEERAHPDTVVGAVHGHLHDGTPVGPREGETQPRLASTSPFQTPGNPVTKYTTTFTDAPAPVYMVAGTGGAGYTDNSEVGHHPEWSRRVFYRWGYATLTATTHEMTIDWIDAVTGTSLDVTTFHKTNQAAKPRFPWIPVAIGSTAFLVLLLGAVFFYRNRDSVCQRHSGPDETRHLLPTLSADASATTTS